MYTTPEVGNTAVGHRVCCHSSIQKMASVSRISLKLSTSPGSTVAVTISGHDDAQLLADHSVAPLSRTVDGPLLGSLSWLYVRCTLSRNPDTPDGIVKYMSPG